MIPLIPVAFALAVGAVAVQKLRGKKTISEARKKIFEDALRTQKNPQKLRDLAKAFDKEGLGNESKILKKRADVLAAPSHVKAKRKEVFKKALTSKDPVAVKKVATAFHETGYYNAAQKLRSYSRGLVARQSKGTARVAGEPDFEETYEGFDTGEFDMSQDIGDGMEAEANETETSVDPGETDGASDDEITEIVTEGVEAMPDGASETAQ